MPNGVWLYLWNRKKLIKREKRHRKGTLLLIHHVSDVQKGGHVCLKLRVHLETVQDFAQENVGGEVDTGVFYLCKVGKLGMV